MHQEYDISVITINYNGLDDTCALIDSLPFDDYALEVIVVDNASREDEASVIEQRYPQVTVIRRTWGSPAATISASALHTASTCY